MLPVTADELAAAVGVVNVIAAPAGSGYAAAAAAAHEDDVMLDDGSVDAPIDELYEYGDSPFREFRRDPLNEVSQVLS